MEKEKDTYLNMYTLGIYLKACARVHTYTYFLGMTVEPTWKDLQDILLTDKKQIYI